MSQDSVLNDAPSEIRTSVVVIGSGPGGSISAALLAERGWDVVLVEEGPFLPLESCQPFSIEEMQQKYRNGGLTFAFGHPKVVYVEGRCVGGGSEVNSGLYHRAPPDAIDRWRRLCDVADFTEPDLIPHFETFERDLKVSLVPGGRTPPASQKLHEGASRLGWKSLEVPRWFAFDGSTDTLGYRKGTRQSMTQTFIPRFLRAGGKLAPNVRIDRLRKEGGAWVVQGFQDGKKAVEIHAETVFVCAGAIQTPALLLRSGIRHQIGNQLQMHPTVKVTALFPDVVNEAGMGVPVHQVKEFSPRVSFGCSISSRPYLALGMQSHPRYRSWVGQEWKRMAIYYCMISGGGEGTVRSIPGLRDPWVSYRLSDTGLRDLAWGLRKLCETLFAANASICFPGVSGMTPIQGLETLTRIPGMLSRSRSSLMTIHLFGSCPMGEKKDQTACDSYGKVHETQGLIVSDASLFCDAPGVNPQGTVMALARRNVLRFCGEL